MSTPDRTVRWTGRNLDEVTALFRTGWRTPTFTAYRDVLTISDFDRRITARPGDVIVRGPDDAAHLLPTVAYTTAADSPGDCPLCTAPMERTWGLWPDPDVNGNPILDEQDVCQGPTCGLRLPVVGDEWDRPDVRRRVAAALNRPAHQEASHA